MLHNSNNKDKLVPLRKFAVPGVYSTAYLSQLVQRKKLKAKKIGRNYYTTKEWFSEYLSQHARDEKQDRYQKFLVKQKKKYPGISDQLTQGSRIIQEQLSDKSGVNFFVLGDKEARQLVPRTKKINLKSIAISMAIFIMIIVNLYFIKVVRDRGQVAGVSETNNEILINDANQATSSKQQFK